MPNKFKPLTLLTIPTKNDPEENTIYVENGKYYIVMPFENSCKDCCFTSDRGCKKPMLRCYKIDKDNLRKTEQFIFREIPNPSPEHS